MQRSLLIAVIAVAALGLVCVVLYAPWRKLQVAGPPHDATPLRVLTLVRVDPAENPESAKLADQRLGEWAVMGSYINGESVFIANPACVHVYLFYKGALPLLAEEPFGRQEWTIDGSRSPALANVRVIRDSTESPAAARPGIVSVDGDALEHCRAFGDMTPRPSTFGEKLAQGYGAMSWRRLK